MTSRRRFLTASALSAAGLLVPFLDARAHEMRGARPKLAGALRKFVDALPRPARVAGTELDIPVTEMRHAFHADLPATTVWGYAGSYPGPTIEATRGVATRVLWRNALADPALLGALPVDQTLHWADPLGAHRPGHGRSHRPYAGPVPLVTHLHGGETEPASDGHPDAWFTPGFERKGPGWVKERYEYANQQPAATLWYHDHALGITRLTVYAGLAGFYLVREPEIERSLHLPEGDYDREIVIQDRALDDAGRLLYPRNGVNPSLHPYWRPEFFGHAIAVNGKLWPYMDVEPRRYRLRFLNGSNSRFYDLRLSDGRPLVQIASDGGLLPAPVEMGSLVLAPGERAELVVDFGGLAPGATVTLANTAPTPYPEGEEPDPETTGTVMQFRVVPLTRPDAGALPARLADLLPLGPATVTRTLTLDERMGKGGPLAALLDGKRWNAPVTETPRLGDTELWEIVNLTADAHPIHLHLVAFRVLDRQRFDAAAFQRAPIGRRSLARSLQGSPRAPDENERGWKDTARANPGEVTRFLVRFAPIGGGAFPFDPTARPGYAWHCHVLEHEDNEMMRPYTLRAG